MLGNGVPLPTTGMRRVTHIERLPRLRGAYVLVIDTVKETPIKIGQVTNRLPPGRYLYCGSAWGPGGIRARVGRHLKKGKSLRWHIDRLTVNGEIRNVVVAPGGSECTLLEYLFALPGAEVPIPGFGSSDCRRCPSHLLHIADGATFSDAIPLKDGCYLL